MIRRGTEVREADKLLDPERGIDRRAESREFDRLKAELVKCFAAPESSYRPMTADEVIARNKV